MNHLYTQVMHHNEAQVLIDIEYFVMYARTQQVSFERFLPQLIRNLTLFHPMYQPERDYAASLAVFIALKHHVDQHLGHCHYTQLYNVEQDVIVQFYQLLLGDESLFENEREQTINQHMANLHGIQLYLRGVVNQHHRLLAVRVDLHYQVQCLHQVNITTFHSDIQLLLSSLGKQTNCFTEIVGYVWSLGQRVEYGGYYIRLLLLVNGSKYSDAWHMIARTGQCWHDITQGEGYAFNPYEIEQLQYLQEQGRLEPGIIYSNNPKLCQRVFDCGTELVKQENPLRVKLSSTMHTFGWGHMGIVKWRGNDDRTYNDDLSGWAV
ncbi:MAG: inovirus Gp2 family protein [Moraxellaceae bacterium]|nr:MAG: inovirus Gp2 family protein [Moraxellaceae bacterium]